MDASVSSEKAGCVLILNTNEDTVELLRVVLETAGFVAFSAFVDEIKRGEVDLAPLVAQHRPDCVVFDVAVPYDRQWRFAEHLRTTALLKDLPWVFTTTNVKRVLEQIPSNTELFEIVGKPYDLDQIVNAVRKAMQGAARARRASVSNTSSVRPTE